MYMASDNSFSVLLNWFQNKMPEQTIMLIILKQHLKTDVACYFLILVNERILLFKVRPVE